MQAERDAGAGCRVDLLGLLPVQAPIALKAQGQGCRCRGWEAWNRHPGCMRQVRHQLPHLLQRVALHQDVVLGQQQGGDLAQLPDGGGVRVRDHVPQLVQGVVEVVHPATLPSID